MSYDNDKKRTEIMHQLKSSDMSAYERDRVAERVDYLEEYKGVGTKYLFTFEEENDRSCVQVIRDCVNKQLVAKNSFYTIYKPRSLCILEILNECYSVYSKVRRESNVNRLNYIREIKKYVAQLPDDEKTIDNTIAYIRRVLDSKIKAETGMFGTYFHASFLGVTAGSEFCYQSEEAISKITNLR
jgi:hypothetical protein